MLSGRYRKGWLQQYICAGGGPAPALCSSRVLKRLESSEEICVNAVIWSSRGRRSTRFSCTRTCPAQTSLEQRQRVKPLIATMFSHMVSRVSIPNTFKCALSLRIKNDMEHFTAFMPLR